MSEFYKHPKYLHVYGNPLRMPDCRIAWPALVEPKLPPPNDKGEVGQARFEATFLLPKEAPEVKTFLDMLGVMATGMNKLFNEGKKTKTVIDTTDLLKDGDTYDNARYPFYAGHYVLIARNPERPSLGGASNGEAADPSIFRGGNICRALVTPLITTHGVSFKLLAMRFIKDDGVKFGGGVNKGAYLGMLSDDAAVEEVDAEVEAEAETAEVEEAKTAKVLPKKKAGKAAGLELL